MENFVFFADGKRKIYFVLVYNMVYMNEKRNHQLSYFLNSLSHAGLDTEIAPFSVDKNTYFIKIHASIEVMIKYADIYDIDLAYRSSTYIPITKLPPHFMFTPLTEPNPRDPVYHRALETLSGDQPKNITSSEKILVLNKVLENIEFGPEPGQFGIQKLFNEKVLSDAYPLHEGPYEWTETGLLSDRQLLARFWGNPRCWYKEQPLNLIDKYYGTEYAFYFAWLGYYVKMLIPAAALSILFLIYGIATIKTAENIRSEEICNSNIIMCPRCQYVGCKFQKLQNSCTQSYLIYLFENPATITFAVVISFWSTIFMELWQRREAVLELKWNVKSLENDTSKRPEYVEAATHIRYSAVIDDYEPYIPNRNVVARYIITLSSVGLLLAVTVLATFGVMVYRLTINTILERDTEESLIKKNTEIIASTTGSFMSASFILIFKRIYVKVALVLTNFENHRTQNEYDNSYIYKNYALAFANNYAAAFYIAFLKGRFYTYPGDDNLWKMQGIGSDICEPTGCILDLGVQLIIIMLMKIIASNFIQTIIPLITGWYKRCMNRVKNHNIPIYEKEFLMAPTDRFFLVDEYMDMVIQYGFVVFFVSGFPLAPVLAVINNFIEVRVDAYKLSRNYRRPVSKKVTGLGAWFAILQAITYVGVVTNALVIAFTSDFVSKEVYRHQTDSSLRGFTNATISAYSIKDGFTFHRYLKDFTETCYYPGKRYPPDHEYKYQHTRDYYYMLALQFLVVVVFEHVVVILKGILAYAIPDVPEHVVLQLAFQAREDNEMRLKHVKDTYMQRYPINTSVSMNID